MTPSYRKKLIEVALPLEAINKASAREKSIRHGHPSTLHLWWARRPLAACRAVLFASLVDDPDSDPHYKMPDGTILESAAAKRSDLFNLIEELVQWENSNNDNVIRSARAEIARCVASRLIETGKLAKDTPVFAKDTNDAPVAEFARIQPAPGDKLNSCEFSYTAQDLVERCHCRPRFMGIDKKLERSRYHLDPVDQVAIEYAQTISLYLAFAVDRAADYWSQMATWMPRGTIRQTFARQRIAMNWDWAEGNPFGSINCAWHEGINWIAKVIHALPSEAIPGCVRQEDAATSKWDEKALLVSTDPPYYDNIPYAECSDFFYVWLRNSLASFRGAESSLLQTMLTPKTEELVANPARHGGSREGAKHFFEEGLRRVFLRSRHIQDVNYPMTVYYAFKQTESEEADDDEGISASGDGAIASTGWETMLAGLADSGLSIHGTWPMRTERSARNISIGTNALASSIILVCRPRPADAPLATRKQFIAALRQELPVALRNLQQGNIAPVDLAQAAIGPGMAVFTRYAKVMEADGRAMSVRTALGLINQSLDEVLAEQEGEFDAETRWAVAWFEQYAMNEGPFGVAETLSRAKNTAVNGLVAAGIIEAEGGKVRFWKREELPDGWDPATDKRLTAWEVTQYLIRALESEGESGAAALVRKLGGIAETARDLAYRLYSICERKKWAEEALAYNGLVIAWPELTKLALAERNRVVESQGEMFS